MNERGFCVLYVQVLHRIVKEATIGVGLERERERENECEARKSSPRLATWRMKTIMTAICSTSQTTRSSLTRQHRVQRQTLSVVMMDLNTLVMKVMRMQLVTAKRRYRIKIKKEEKAAA